MQCKKIIDSLYDYIYLNGFVIYNKIVEYILNVGSIIEQKNNLFALL